MMNIAGKKYGRMENGKRRRRLAERAAALRRGKSVSYKKGIIQFIEDRRRTLPSPSSSINALQKSAEVNNKFLRSVRPPLPSTYNAFIR
jgi:predicted nucleic acid-binding Zn ribbon protein